MRRSWLARGSLLGLLVALAVPAVASADSLDAAGNGVLPDSVAINSLWVLIAGMFVMFMQAGFAFLEIGFSRGKNAGTVIAAPGGVMSGSTATRNARCDGGVGSRRPAVSRDE